MNATDSIRVSLGGDVMCLSEETMAIKRKYCGFEYYEYLSGLKQLFEDADYSIANLETPISPSNELSDSSIRFNTNKNFLAALKDVGFDFFSTANNHCLDRGLLGVDETIDSLEEFGLSHDGTFKSQEDSEKVFVTSVAGLRVAICCFTFGTNSDINGEILSPDQQWRVALLKKQPKLRKVIMSSDLSSGSLSTYVADCVTSAAIGNPVNEAYVERAMAKVRSAKELSDFVIVMPHVGGQYNPGPAAYTKYIVSRFKETGADMVIAGHPHVPQRCENWDRNGSFVCYSLGNLCFTPNVGYYVRNVLAEYGIVLHAYIGKMTKKLERVTFDVVKNVVDEDGCTHVLPVTDVLHMVENASARDRLLMEVEIVVNRFRGTCDDIAIQREYEFFKTK